MNGSFLWRDDAVCEDLQIIDIEYAVTVYVANHITGGGFKVIEQVTSQDGKIKFVNNSIAVKVISENIIGGLFFADIPGKAVRLSRREFIWVFNAAV